MTTHEQRMTGRFEVGTLQPPRIAVLIPCYNEAEAIGSVIRDFAAALPEASIYVYDNNSRDRTREIAAAAGAIVRTETFQGKGNVVRRMFADVEAEVYVLVDGDGTYHAPSARGMVDDLLTNSLDMVNGARVPVAAAAFRPGHVLGNRMLTGTVALIFGDRLKDMLSSLEGTQGQRVAICGTGEVAELAYLALREMNIDCVGFVDGTVRDTFLSCPVSSPDRIAGWQFDRVLIADLDHAATYEEQLVRSGVPRDKVLKLGLRQ